MSKEYGTPENFTGFSEVCSRPVVKKCGKKCLKALRKIDPTLTDRDNYLNASFRAKEACPEIARSRLGKYDVSLSPEEYASIVGAEETIANLASYAINGREVQS